MADAFDPYFAWLGVRAENGRPDHYELLGLPRFHGDPAAIKSAAETQMARARLFESGPHALLGMRIVGEIIVARDCLLDPARREHYDAALLTDLATRTPAPQPGAIDGLLPPSSADATAADYVPEAIPLHLAYGVAPLTAPPMASYSAPGESPRTASPATIPYAAPMSNVPVAAVVSAPGTEFVADSSMFVEESASTAEPLLPHGGGVPAAPTTEPEPSPADHHHAILAAALPASSTPRHHRPSGPLIGLATMLGAMGLTIVILWSILGGKPSDTSSSNGAANNNGRGDTLSGNGKSTAKSPPPVRPIAKSSAQPQVEPPSIPSRVVPTDPPPAPTIETKTDDPHAPMPPVRTDSPPSPEPPATKTDAVATVATKTDETTTAPPKTEPAKTETALPETRPEPTPEPVADPKQIAAVRANLNAARQAMRERDLAKAKEQLALATLDATHPKLIEEIERLSAVHHCLAEYWSAVRQGVAGLKSTQELEVKGAKLLVVEADEHHLIIRMQGKNQNYAAIEAIPAILAYKIASDWLDKKDPNSKTFLAAFWMIDPKGNKDEARRLLTEAKKEGAEVDLMLQEIDAPPEAAPSATVSGATSATAGVMPLPTDAELDRVRARHKQQFDDDYKRATTLVLRAALADRLHKQGRDAIEPAGSFVLLEDALRQAGAAGSAAIIEKVADDMGGRFGLDPVMLKTDALERAVEATQAETAHRAIARLALKLVDQAVAEQKGPFARRLIVVARASSEKSNDAKLVSQAASKQQLVDTLPQ